MARLPNRDFQQTVALLKDKDTKKEIYPGTKQRKIVWPAYTPTQIHALKETLVFIRDSVDACSTFSTKGKVGRPLTNPKSLAKAVLFCEFIQSPEREAQGWLELIGPFLGIYEDLDDWVIGRAYERPEVAYILQQVFMNNKESDSLLSGDGTGLERSRKQNYASNKKQGTYMTSIVDSREIVQTFDISGIQECQIMHELVKQVTGDSIRLDAGFNDHALVELIDKLGMTCYVYPKISNILNGRIAWKSMYLYFFWDIYSWLKEYHQRSHCESFHSAFKRVYGIVTKVKYASRLSQVSARIILHNRRRLAYFSRIEKSG